MKQRVFWKILTMALVLGAALALAACGNNNDNGEGGGPNINLPPPGGPNVPAGSTLNLNGQVYVINWDTVELTQFTDNRDLVGMYRGEQQDVTHGTGAIINGQLSFTTDTPPAGAFRSWAWRTDPEEWQPWTIDPPAARFAELWLRLQSDDGSVWKGQEFPIGDCWDTAEGEVEEEILFVYADMAVNIRASRVVDIGNNHEAEHWESGCDCVACIGSIAWHEIAEAFNINLRQGWNALRFRGTEWETSRNNAIMYYATYSLHLGIPPHLNWVLSIWGGHSADIEAVAELVETQGRERPGRAFGARLR